MASPFYTGRPLVPDPDPPLEAWICGRVFVLFNNTLFIRYYNPSGKRVDHLLAAQRAARAT